MKPLRVKDLLALIELNPPMNVSQDTYTNIYVWIESCQPFLNEGDYFVNSELWPDELISTYFTKQ